MNRQALQTWATRLADSIVELKPRDGQDVEKLAPGAAADRVAELVRTTKEALTPQ